MNTIQSNTHGYNVNVNTAILTYSSPRNTIKYHGYNVNANIAILNIFLAS